MQCSFCGAALDAITTSCRSCGAQPVLGERYEIKALLGRGGMGEVFLGHDRRLDTEVAIKRLPPQFASSSELRDSLLKEARILARLSDSAIVRLFDVEEFHGGFYLILEYVCGPTLRQLIESGYRFSPSDVMGIVAQVAQGLTTAHRSGVIHRDLKPSNLMLSFEGADRDAYRQSARIPPTLANARVKITDFGIAKAIADARLTLTNAFSGTPGYMAPEQFHSQTPSPQTDVYALGIVTRELLVNTAVHPAVEEVLNTATAADRQARFPSVEAFANALHHAFEGRPLGRPPLQPARARASSMIWVFVCLLVMGVVVALALIIPARRSATSGTAATNKFPKVEKPVPIEWRSPPRITEPPPPVASAAAPPPTELEGPARPRVKWSILLPTTGSPRIEVVGADGTVYAGSFPYGILAIRDGKVLWAYKAGFGVSDVQLDRLGRLWYRTMDGVFCFNREGKGGRLPKGWPEPPSVPQPKSRCYAGGIVDSGRLRIELDGDCTSETVADGIKDRRIYTASDQPLLQAFDQAGRAQWQIKPACEPAHLLPVLPNHVLYRCKEGTLHSVVNGQETWTHASDGQLSRAMLADSKGTFFYSDRSASGDAHVHAIGSDGAERWKVVLEGGSANDLVLGPNGRLYVANSSLYSRLTCLE